MLSTHLFPPPLVLSCIYAYSPSHAHGTHTCPCNAGVVVHASSTHTHILQQLLLKCLELRQLQVLSSGCRRFIGNQVQ